MTATDNVEIINVSIIRRFISSRTKHSSVQRPFMSMLIWCICFGVVGVFVREDFRNESVQASWKVCNSDKFTGSWSFRDSFLRMGTPNAFHAIGKKFETPFEIRDRDFVLQFSVRAETDNVTCSGAYVKVFGGPEFNPELGDYTNYVMMFGPDKCGMNDKIHFMLRMKNLATGVIEEHAMVDPPRAALNTSNTEYRLVIHPNANFEIYANRRPQYFGSLLKDMTPPISPPRHIDDPNDVKPADWIDDEYIVDETATKPADWDETAPEFIPDPERLNPPDGWLVDEPKFITDPNAVKPEEWDDDIHGTWEPAQIPNPRCEQAPGCGPYEPPLVVNPKYVGEWEPPMYRNPMYRGPWKPRRIKNPHYYEVRDPQNIGTLYGIGLDLWTVEEGVQFANITITDDLAALGDGHYAEVPATPTPVPVRIERRPRPQEPAQSSLAQVWMTSYNNNAIATVSLTIAVILFPWLASLLVCRPLSRLFSRKSQTTD